MNKISKKIIAGFIAVSVIFMTSACFSAQNKAEDNAYGGKTYYGGSNEETKEYKQSIPLPNEFPSDKVPVLNNATVGWYKVIYAENEKLTNVKLKMHSKADSKEIASNYKNFYADADITAEKNYMNKKMNEITIYRYLFLKGDYVYGISVSKKNNKDYSVIWVRMEERNKSYKIENAKDLEHFYTHLFV